MGVLDCLPLRGHGRASGVDGRYLRAGADVDILLRVEIFLAEQNPVKSTSPDK